ncbi:MAG: thioredoxin-disulfide reductase, partial [Candidatus Aminicenantes bacterium]|nr:thioredoxin-disulfide reductase [Candidatus Aminicenantes bacterium]
GPAGLSAAIYAARANLKPLVFEGYQSGGQLMITTEVENFPGFKDGILGPDLIAAFRAQAERFGTEFITSDVTKVQLSKDKKIIWEGENSYQTMALIIATGATANLLGLKQEKELMGRGVSVCATCDGFFFKDKTICVVGGGDSAMEEAIFLTRFASKVYIIHRRDAFRASKIMVSRAEKNPKIEFVLDSVVDDILGENSITGIRLKNTKTNSLHELKVDGIFIAIGHTPNTDLFKGQINMDKKGYIISSNEKYRLTATNLSGVFACGDVQDSHYRQAITAAGSGCMAAMDAEHYLESILLDQTGLYK